MSKDKERRIIIVDDDTEICFLLQQFLQSNGYTVDTAFTSRSGLDKMREQPYNLAILDFRLPDIDGFELLQEVKRLSPETQVIIVTGYSDVKMAVQAVKSGAFEYVTKPVFPEEILVTIKQALNAPRMTGMYAEPATADDPKTTEKKAASTPSRSGSQRQSKYVRGSGIRSKQIHSLMELVAPTNMTVLILGESGVGKEVMANAIHNMSKRADKPFVAVDCGAIPKELASSELFGHVKGSFTGAVSDKAGYFEHANGGTLFLDEIGNLNYETQIKLLRALQERQIRRVGDLKNIPVDVRIIAATNENLEDRMKKGEFREDLFYRVNEFAIDLPPLRERKPDLPEFVNYFLEMANAELEKGISQVDDEVMQKFREYHWPGNLREMKNVIKRAVLLTQGTTLATEVLPREILNPVLLEAAPDSPQEELGSYDLKEVAARAEKRAILEVLKKTGYNKSRTAELLNVDRKTLYNKMNSYGINI